MTLIALRNIGHVFYRIFLVRFAWCFSHEKPGLLVNGKNTTAVKFHFFITLYQGHILSTWFITVNIDLLGTVLTHWFYFISFFCFSPFSVTSHHRSHIELHVFHAVSLFQTCYSQFLLIHLHLGHSFIFFRNTDFPGIPLLSQI